MRKTNKNLFLRWNDKSCSWNNIYWLGGRSKFYGQFSYSFELNNQLHRGYHNGASVSFKGGSFSSRTK